MRIAQDNTGTGVIVFPTAAVRSPLEASRNLLHRRAEEAPAMSATGSRITRHNRVDAAGDQAAGSARSRELFMPVPLLRGPGASKSLTTVLVASAPAC